MRLSTVLAFVGGLLALANGGAKCEESMMGSKAANYLEQKLEAIWSSLEAIAAKQDGLRADLQELKLASAVRCQSAEEEEQQRWQPTRFNRLASNLIPMSGGDGSHDEASATKEPASQTSDRYETQLRQWALGLKEQLAHFRATLNKVLAAQADARYQSELFAGQLLLIKDECSLAAGAATGAAQPPAQQAATATSAAAAEAATLRATDMAALVKLLASGRMEWPQADGHKLLVDRLDQIGSVVKQSALVLQQLLARHHHQQAPTTTLEVRPTPVANMAEQLKLKWTLNGTTAATKSRWLPGSKVPLISASSSMVSSEPPAACQNPPSTKLEAALADALSSPNSTTSCQSLREAGANCSGKYLVRPIRGGPLEQAYCEMAPEAMEGWQVVLRRLDKRGHQQQQQPSGHFERLKAAQLDFNQDWAQYKAGFGALDEWDEFFVGLERLHRLSEAAGERGLELRVEGEAGAWRRRQVAHLGQVRLGNESSGYRLTFSNCRPFELCSGLLALNDTLFSTHDHNDCPISDSQPQKRWGWWLVDAIRGGDLSVSECKRRLEGALTRPLGPSANQFEWLSGRLYLRWPDETTKVDEWSQRLYRLVLKVRAGPSILS